MRNIYCRTRESRENLETTTIREQLLAGKLASAKTTGVSMQPLLYEQKTQVIIKSIFLSDGNRRILKKGDLPIYLRPDGVYVIHRLIKETENNYYTRGDNCLTSEKIPKEWVLGIVSTIYRKGKVIQVTDKGYLRYVSIWMALYPARSIYYRSRILLHKIIHKIKRNKKK